MIRLGTILRLRPEHFKHGRMVLCIVTGFLDDQLTLAPLDNYDRGTYYSLKEIKDWYTVEKEPEFEMCLCVKHGDVLLAPVFIKGLQGCELRKVYNETTSF